MECLRDTVNPAVSLEPGGQREDDRPAPAPWLAPEPSDWHAPEHEWRRAETATWAVAAAIYGGWLALTWFYHAAPWWLVLPLGGYLVAWHGSLLHETVHGHPARARWVNELLAFPSLWLWLPYGLYRESHLAHHDCPRLTCPVTDPESFYVTPEAWRAMGRTRRTLRTFRNTLIGRLVLGPAFVVSDLLVGEARRLAQGDVARLRHWVVHGVSVTPVIAWAVFICGIPLWEYVLVFAYPGLSLTLLRSYAEHRPGRDSTAIVDAGPVFSLLFLNNNLHAVHHDRPGLPWVLVARYYRADRDRIDGQARPYRFDGYREIARRFLFRPKDSPEHPGIA